MSALRRAHLLALAIFSLGAYLGFASPAAAQSTVRVDELFFACSNGDTTIQFIEIVNSGPDTVFNGSMRIEYLRDGQTVGFDLQLWSSLHNTAWPAGGRFLFSVPKFSSRFQFPPDYSNLSLRMSRTGGLVRLYVLDQTGGRIVYDQATYGGASGSPAPPNGLSLNRRPDGSFGQSSPSPTTRSGLTPQSGAGCLSLLPLGTLSLEEVMLRCRSGATSGQFIELKPASPTTVLASELGLRYFDRAGVLLADLPSVTATRLGVSMATSQRWLLALDSANWSGPVDGTLPAPLDTVRGRIVVYEAKPSGETTVFDFAYGGPAQPAVPAPGASLQRIAGGNSFQVQTTPSPASLASGAVVPKSSCDSPPLSSVRINEVQTLCRSGARLSFIELKAASDDWFDPGFVLRVFAADGLLLGELDAPFGSRLSQRWPSGRTWLIAAAGFRSATGDAPDRILDFALDPSGGRIELSGPDARDGVSTAVQTLTYGNGSTPAPGLGQTLVQTSPGVYAISSSPSPESFDQKPFGAPSCAVDPITSARVHEFQLVCANGDTAGRFIELGTIGTADVFDSSLVLRIFDRNGGLLGEHRELFGSSTGQAWATSRSWVLAASAWTPSSGPLPDGALRPTLDPVAGRLELLARPTIGGDQRTVDVVEYGTSLTPRPPRGLSAERAPDGTFAIAPQPSPTNRLGQQLVNPIGCVRPPFATARVEEMGLKCLVGSTDFPFVEISNAGPPTVRDSTLTLRFADRSSVELGELRNPWGARAGQAWPADQHWFIGAAGWKTAADAPPETVLPFEPDPEGGTVTIEQRDPETGEVFVVQRLVYGTTSNPSPGPGMSLQRTPAGGYVAGPSSPSGSAGQSYLPSARCLAPSRSTAKISEVSFACSNGASAGQFIDLTSTASNDILDDSFSIRIYDRNQNFIGELVPASDPAPFTYPHAGEPWGAGRQIMIGTPLWIEFLWWGDSQSQDLLSYPAVDRFQMYMMDQGGGRLDVVARDRASGIVSVTQSLHYGPGGLPVPPAGGSLELSPGGEYLERSTATPIGWLGTAPSANLGCDGARMSEIFTSCAVGASGTSFVEISRNSTSYWGPITTQLRAFDRDGGLLGSVSNPLPMETITSWDGRSTLSTSPAFSSVFGAAGDHALSSALDPAGGRVELGWTPPHGPFQVLDDVSYGPGTPVPAPPAGSSLTRDPNGGWTVVSPSPARWDRRGFHDPECFDSQNSPIVIQQFLPACRCPEESWFVQFSTNAPMTFPGGATLVALDAGGSEILRAQDVFAGRAGLQWFPGSAWLVSTAELQGLYDFSSDARFPGTLDAEGGRVILLLGTGGSHADTLASFAYGAGTEAGIGEPGQSWQRQPNGSFALGDPWPVAYSGPPAYNPRRCEAKSTFARLTTALASCETGESGVSYLQVYIGSGFPSFPDGIGLRAFGGSGEMLFRLAEPFGSRPCWRATGGSTWLLATAAFQQLTQATVDGTMPAPLDPIRGRIEAFMQTTHGDSVFDTFSYGGPGELAMQPGHAMFRWYNGYGSYIYSIEDAAPIGTDGVRIHAPRCIEDGPPPIEIREFLPACVDGGLRAQYVECKYTAAPDFHDARLRFIAFDSSGVERMRIEHVGDAFDGRPIPVTNSLLLAGPEFEAATGLAPDIVWAGSLDPRGGRLRLEWVRSPGAAATLIEEWPYGPVPPGAWPPRGSPIRPHDEHFSELTYPARPNNFALEIATNRSCFSTRCSPFRMYAQGATVFSDSTVGSLSRSDRDGYGSASYDWRALRFDAAGGGSNGGGGTVEGYETFRLDGPSLGTPFDLVIRLHAHVSPHSSGHHSGAGGKVFLGTEDGFVQLSSSFETMDSTITQIVHVRVGEPFMLRMGADAWGFGYFPSSGGSATSRLNVSFDNLPFGLSLRSCHGLAIDGAVPTTIALTRVNATPERVELRWHGAKAASFETMLERRRGEDEWQSLAALHPDADGSLFYADEAVVPGERYVYRLTWTIANGRPKFSEEVAVQVPLLYRFALKGARPNPARGPFDVEFELAEPGPATLEWLDVAGRRVREERFVLERGAHLTRQELRGLAPGVYMLRLNQGGNVAHLRVIYMP